MNPISMGEASVEAGTDRGDRGYDEFRVRIQARFSANLAEGKGVLFTTNAEGLFEAYLDALPGDRQYHACHACRRFVETYGGLATIDESGVTRPAVWDEVDAPEYYRLAVAAIARLVRRANVTGVFHSAAEVWGQPVTGPWTHYAVTPPIAFVYGRALLTAGQKMAEKLEDCKTVRRALADFDAATLAQALRVLESETLYRSEEVIGPARWLRNLRAASDAVHGERRVNIIWRAVALAPAGFCHPRSSMVGTLLDDIAGGLDFAEVSRRFAAKMHPLQYQRPQAAPSAGNIAQAEKIVEQLGIAPSLARRFARLDEVEAIWKPTPRKPASATGGVFSHLTPKDATGSHPALAIPAVTMTWEKFARTVLPTAETIEVYAGSGASNFGALVTAVDPDAPPILQWDRPDRRNPVSWYVYNGGSRASHWGLAANAFHKANAVALNPSQWGGAESSEHQGRGVIFILDGAKDSRLPGLALFPETLKAELRAIRSTIEAHSASGKMQGREDASACGLMLSKGGTWSRDFGVRLRVTSGGQSQEYRIDRWD